MNLHEAIFKLNPNVVTISDDTAYDVNGNEVAYDKQSAEDLVIANQYKYQRQQAYPSISDQLDTLYHGGYDAWKASIEAVKNQFPKP